MTAEDWFRDTFRSRFQMKRDELGDPYLPLKPAKKGGIVYAYAVGRLGIWLNRVRKGIKLAAKFSELELAQDCADEAVYLWPASSPKTDQLLRAAGAYPRRHMTDQQRQAAGIRLDAARRLAIGIKAEKGRPDV